MALPLLAIGDALGTMLSGRKGTSSSAGAHNDLSFGLHLSQKLDPLGNDESALLSQLAGMLQAGTPLATIVDRLAKALSNALASATGNQGNVDRQRTLERALASALAPPGASPPGQTGAAKVPTQSTALSLERRLGELVSRISRELQTAGQQNRFSGAVLDANSAREIPAQQVKQHPTGTQTPAGSVDLAQSILRDVVAQLQNASLQQQQPAPVQPATLQTASQSASAQAAQITVRSSDVLGRMLARAAKADPAGAAAPANPLQSSDSAASPSDLFARLIDVIAQATNEQSASGTGKEGSRQFASSKNDLAAVHHAPATSTNTPAPAFSTALNAATAPAVQASSAPIPYTVDPQSVIEQVVKGIVLRNFGTTSEVRMRLQPEHLGDVALKLTVTGNTVSANIVAQNPDVRNLLLGNQQQLARALAEAGLSLGSFSVDVSGGNPGFSQRQTPQHRSVLKTGALDAGTAAEDDTWADARFGPPVLTGAKSLVLNYLA